MNTLNTDPTIQRAEAAKWYKATKFAILWLIFNKTIFANPPKNDLFIIDANNNIPTIISTIPTVLDTAVINIEIIDAKTNPIILEGSRPKEPF